MTSVDKNRTGEADVVMAAQDEVASLRLSPEREAYIDDLQTRYPDQEIYSLAALVGDPRANRLGIAGVDGVCRQALRRSAITRYGRGDFLYHVPPATRWSVPRASLLQHLLPYPWCAEDHCRSRRQA